MRMTLFAYGFRPFFLLAGVAALLLVPLWALHVLEAVPLAVRWPASLWHGHEMLFGFIMSAIAGFMLTAVPSWTGQPGFSGRPLIVLASLWLAARVMIATAARWPAFATAVIDLAFLPVLAGLLAWPLLRARNRNTPLLLALGALWLCNLAFHRALLAGHAAQASHALEIGVDLVLVMVTMIGGRIVPAFTASALRLVGRAGSVANRPWIGALTLLSMVLVTLGDLAQVGPRSAGGLAALAAMLQSVRLLQWGGIHTTRQPIVWILHVAYAWLPIGLALKALALLAGSAVGAFWLHALTVGALSTMILAVMTRASLGHTGRVLKVDPLISFAYLLLSAAAVIRVWGLPVLGMSYPIAIATAAALWTAAFGLFVAIYAPILCSPRADGKPG